MKKLLFIVFFLSFIFILNCNFFLNNNERKDKRISTPNDTSAINASGINTNILQINTANKAANIREEIISARTEKTKTYDNKNGTFSVEIHMKSIHYKNANGQWADITTEGSLKATATADQVTSNETPKNAYWAYPTQCAYYWYTVGLRNIVGNTGDNHRHRQTFYWSIPNQYHSYLTITAMEYTYHCNNVQANLNILSCGPGAYNPNSLSESVPSDAAKLWKEGADWSNYVYSQSVTTSTS